MANYMFELAVTNAVRNATQNVAGVFGAYSGETFTPATCDAGILCVKDTLIPSEGYESIVDSAGNPAILNGNTWRFLAAATGKASGTHGDHTGIYACNTYNVNRAVSGDNAWNLGANTLGIQTPAGERVDMTELIIGEQYVFGASNFSTLPADATYKYITISNGKLVASTTAPASDIGVYFELLRTKNVTEGNSHWGIGYVMEAKRAAELPAVSASDNGEVLTVVTGEWASAALPSD